MLLVLICGGLLAACTGNMAPVSGPGQRSANGVAYVVQRGDTLYTIAWRNGLDYRAVARWNRIDPPYLIRPGQRLRLSIPPQSTHVSEPSVRSEPKPAARQAAAPKAPVKSRPVAAGGVTPTWRWPAVGTLTRQFTADAQGKQGLEVSGRLGSPISAAARGRVVYAGGGLRGYGNLIIVKHDSRYLTAYGYNQTLLVKEGEQVRAGQKIATMGVGPNREAALHFEIRRDGKPVDPMRYLPAR